MKFFFTGCFQDLASEPKHVSTLLSWFGKGMLNIIRLHLFFIFNIVTFVFIIDGSWSLNLYIDFPYESMFGNYIHLNLFKLIPLEPWRFIN